LHFYRLFGFTETVSSTVGMCMVCFCVNDLQEAASRRQASSSSSEAGVQKS